MTDKELEKYLLEEQLTNISNALLNMFTRTKSFYFQVITTLTVEDNGRYEVSTPDNFPVFTPKGQGFLADGGDYKRGEMKLWDLENEDPREMARELIQKTFSQR